MTLRELILGVLPEPLNLRHWFILIDISDPKNWFVGDLHPMEFYDFA